MIFKLVCFVVLSTAVLLFNNCSRLNTPISQVKKEAPEIKTIAVPQIEVVETPRFKELKRQFETAENEVARLDEERKRLLTTYTEKYSKVKIISRKLAKAEEKLKIAEQLLNSERDKLEYRTKNSPV